MIDYRYWVDPKVAQRELGGGSVAVENMGNRLTSKQTFRAEGGIPDTHADFVVI